MLPSDDEAVDTDSAVFPLKGRSRATFPNDQWISILPVGLGALVLYETTMRSGLGPWSITNLPLVGVLAFAVLLFGGMAADPFVPHRVQQIGVHWSGFR